MTLDEAAGHVGRPVLIRVAPGRVRTAEIIAVDRPAGLVVLKVRRQTHPYDFLPREERWHPAHLDLPAWLRGDHYAEDRDTDSRETRP